MIGLKLNGGDVGKLFLVAGGAWLLLNLTNREEQEAAKEEGLSWWQRLKRWTNNNRGSVGPFFWIKEKFRESFAEGIRGTLNLIPTQVWVAGGALFAYQAGIFRKVFK